MTSATQNMWRGRGDTEDTHWELITIIKPPSSPWASWRRSWRRLRRWWSSSRRPRPLWCGNSCRHRTRCRPPETKKCKCRRREQEKARFIYFIWYIKINFKIFDFITYLSLHLVLSAEGAVVFTVLRDFHLLDSFPQAGTISGTILSGDTNLLSSLGHHTLRVFLLKCTNITINQT